VKLLLFWVMTFGMGFSLARLIGSHNVLVWVGCLIAANVLVKFCFVGGL
jgi:hypothetical protein